MYNYNLYGLAVSSCIYFNFLKPQSSGVYPDIKIIESKKVIDYQSDKINMDEAILHRKNVGYFKISQGKKIFFYRENTSISDEIISRTIINSIMGFCLYQRGNLVLHGSAIVKNNSSYLFMGPSGSGKSSLSADLSLNHGTNFLCEDVALIQNNDQKLSIASAPKFVKLTNEAAKLLGFKEFDRLNLPSDRLGRSLYKITSKQDSNTIRASFFLEWGRNFEIKEIDKDQLLPAFLVSTYSAFPFNSCKRSTLAFNKNINLFSKNIPMYKLIRNKHDLYSKTNNILKFIDNI